MFYMYTHGPSCLLNFKKNMPKINSSRNPTIPAVMLIGIFVCIVVCLHHVFWQTRFQEQEQIHLSQKNRI